MAKIIFREPNNTIDRSDFVFTEAQKKVTHLEGSQSSLDASCSAECVTDVDLD